MAAFIDTRWRIVYSAACELRRAGTPVCAESVSDFIAFHDLDKEFQHALDPTKTFNWRHWPDHANQSVALSPSPLPIQYCLGELARLYRERQEDKIHDQRKERIISREQFWTAFQDLNHASGKNGYLPEILSAASICAKRTPVPPEVISSVLHLGGKMAFGGGSKSFKTWTLLEMAICVATGRSWLGKFPTTKGTAIFLNFELPQWAMEDRIRQICSAMKVVVPDNLFAWNLRGYATDAAIILPEIQRRLTGTQYTLLVLDPLYKLLGSRDENASRDMADLMNQIEKLAVELGPAIAFGSHYSKGNQASKNPMDRMSGSGVFARDPDTIVTMTEHTEPNAFTIDLTLRNFPQMESFVVRRQHPLMMIDGELDPSKLKQAGGRPIGVSKEEVLSCLVGSMKPAAWQAAAAAKDITESTWDRRRAELVRDGAVFKSELDGEYCRRK